MASSKLTKNYPIYQEVLNTFVNSKCFMILYKYYITRYYITESKAASIIGFLLLQK